MVLPLYRTVPTSGPWGSPQSIPRPTPRGRTPARPGPSYLEMPAKAQMFSVRLPSLSTRHEGPPGPRGHASHAAGTVETSQGSEGERPWHRSRPHPRPARLLTKAPSGDTSPHSPLTATGRLEHIRGCTATSAAAAGRARGTLTWTCRPSPLTHTGAPRPAPLQLTGLPSRQLQLSLVGAASVGPRADHLAADGLLAHQRGRAVRIPQAGMARAPTAF